MSTREVGREREGEHWGKVTKMNTPGVSYCFLGTVGILTLVCSLSWAEGTWDWLNIYIYLVVFSAISWLSFGECDVIMSWGGGIQALKNTSLIRLTLPPPQNQTFLSRHWHWHLTLTKAFLPSLWTQANISGSRRLVQLRVGWKAAVVVKRQGTMAVTAVGERHGIRVKVTWRRRLGPGRYAVILHPAS